MNRSHPEYEQVYAIIRLDDAAPTHDHPVTVKEIVRSLEVAEAEVGRLNELNAAKHCHYFWQATHLFPLGGSAGHRSSGSISSAKSPDA